jgi:hypothetical protein
MFESKIRYIKNKNIDRKKWDECVENSTLPLIYGVSWYLDIVAEHWDGLVYGDYEAVMPLPWKRKWGFKYVYQPAFLQQLGIFSSKPMSEAFLWSFFGKIPKSFAFVTTNINSLCTSKMSLKPGHTNFELDLSENYEILKKNYSENTKRNIKKSQKCAQQINRHAFYIELINMKIREQGDIFIAGNRTKLDSLFNYLINNQIGECITVSNSAGQVLSAAFFSHFKNRIYYLSGISNSAGYENKSMFLIFDNIIKTNSGSNLTLDFEGSDNPNIARFFESFGATKNVYSTFKRTYFNKM